MMPYIQRITVLIMMPLRLILSIQLGKVPLMGENLPANMDLVIGELAVGMVWFTVGYIALKVAEMLAIMWGNLDLY